ncbi:Plasmodium vivax Vir protein, putative [Plasmodium ovale]|uniref:Plasmodium vivax Vir protein, putative n=1 Tax=Plasmodium ovale TaxID=36330 RepID=A0A1C3KJJ9_PLAOA|nr:Plasmodium vivax Vir protein, putative [Plasmodium ovale]
MDVLSDSELEDILKGSTTNGIYDTLNGEVDSTSYSDNCKKLKNSGEDDKKLCTKVEKSLKNLSTKLSTTSENYRCGYFTYWLYDEVRKMYGNGHSKIGEVDDILTIFNAGYEINKTLGKDACYYDYKDYYTFNDLKEMKNLHDYFRNFDYIVNCKNSGSMDNCKKYCRYVSYVYGIYKNNIQRCCNCFYDSHKCTDMCKDYFNCQEMYYPNDLLYKFKCDTYNSNETFDDILALITTDRDAILKSRFTLFGSFIKKRILKKKMVNYNFHNDYSDEISSYERKLLSENPRRGRLHVSYQNA